VGRDDAGLPIGVQVVGRRWQDMELLNFVERLAEFSGPIGCANPHTHE
jgi:amidase